MALIVKSFSISKIIEINVRGEKQSEFLNMKFESDSSLTPKQAMLQQLEAHETVEEAIVYNALASGMMTVDAANERISQLKHRHEGIITVLNKKFGVPDVSSFLDQPTEIKKPEE